MPRTSVQKVQDLIPQLRTAKPRDDSEAALLAVAPMVLPHVLALLPSDPEDLDRELQKVATFILTLHSDPGSHPTAGIPALAISPAPETIE